MSMRWVLLLLLGLNLAYLASGLYRSYLHPDRQGPSSQLESDVGEIRLLDSLADSPPPESGNGRAETTGEGPAAETTRKAEGMEERMGTDL